jgi:Ca-activated chloride channel family protein
MYPIGNSVTSLEDATPELLFSTAVAEFGMLLRDSPYKGQATWDEVVHLAEMGIGADSLGYRGEFVELVRVARSLSE